MITPRIIVPLLLVLGLLCCKPEKPTTHRVKERAVSPADEARARQEAAQSGSTKFTEEQLKTVLAEGKGIRITFGDMMNVVNQMPMEVRQRYRSPERWSELLQEIVAFEILLREADEAGLARDPMVLHTFKSAVAQRYLQEQANHQVQPSNITDAMVNEAYASRPELSQEEALVHAFVFSSDKAEQGQVAYDALKKVEGDLQRLTYRIPEQIASQGDANLGVGETGDAGFINAEGRGLRGGNHVQMVPPKFAELLFTKPEAGVLVGPVHTDRGYMLGFIKSFRPAAQQELGAVAASIRNLLLKEKRAEFRDQLEAKILKEAGLVIDEKVLSEAFPASANPEPTKPKVIVPSGRMRPLNLQHNDVDKRRKMLETTIQEELKSDD
jgi:hypothetical protein